MDIRQTSYVCSGPGQRSNRCVRGRPNGGRHSTHGDPHDRFPNAQLRRWIQIRDLHCTFPGCRVPAHHSEVDHLHDYALGGPTVADNLGLASAGCHAAKTRDGWIAYATEPGRITWRSPLGHEYPPDGPAEYG